MTRIDAHLRAAGMAESPFSRRCPLLDLYAVPLGFYPGWLALCGRVVLAGESLQANFDALMGPGFLWCADGSADMIHALNAGRVPMPRTESNGAPRPLPSPLAALDPRRTGPDYLRFFCHVARAEHGSFRLVQTEADLRDCGATSRSQELATKLTPLRVSWRRAARAPDTRHTPSRGTTTVPPPTRNLLAHGSVFYAGSLYHARFEIDSAGHVTMLDDEPLASDVAPAEVTRRWLRTVRPLSAAGAGA